MKEEVTIVVVDDDQDTTESLKDLLEIDGYMVWTANNGADALPLVAERDPVCVLLDLGMPAMSGHELARRLRKAHGSLLVLIAITGRDDHEERLAAEHAGMDHLLVKPVQAAHLRRLLPPLH